MPIYAPRNNSFNTRDYVDEVKLRLSRYASTDKLNDGVLIDAINNARKSVYSDMKDVMPERFSKILKYVITDDPNKYKKGPLYKGVPMDPYILEISPTVHDIVNVYIRYAHNEENILLNCRRFTPHEINRGSMHSWLRPSMITPAYVFESSLGDFTALAPLNYSSKNILLYGLKSTNSTMFDLSDNDELIIELWVVDSVYEYEWGGSYVTSDTDSTMPIELYEMVIYRALLECSMQMNLIELGKIARMQYVSMVRNMKTNYIRRFMEEKINIPTLFGEQGEKTTTMEQGGAGTGQ